MVLPRVVCAGTISKSIVPTHKPIDRFWGRVNKTVGAVILSGKVTRKNFNVTKILQFLWIGRYQP